MSKSISSTISFKHLDSLFQPESIAIIGASRKKSSVGFAIIKNLIIGGFRGRLFPVNPEANSLLGLKCYDTVLDISEKVEMAVIAVPAKVVPQVLRECGEKGIEAVTIISAGFGEVGDEGEELESEIKSIARENDISFLGPNCLGIINTDESNPLNATFASQRVDEGNISFISQSGAVGIYGLEYAARHNLGLSRFVSLGNKAMINENHLLGYLAKDESTKIILAYLENVEDMRGFIDAALEVTKGKGGKPVLAIKSGRSKSGQEAVASHTGKLSQREEVVDFLFHQAGVIRIKSIEELFNRALCLSLQPLPKGNRVVIVSNAGGPSIIATDEAELAGAEINELPEGLKEKLKSHLPSTASVHNPVDLVGDADAERFEHALEIIINADIADILLVIYTPQMVSDTENLAKTISQFAEVARNKGITLVSSFTSFDREVMKRVNQILGQAKIPNYPFVENAARACTTAIRYVQLRDQPKSEIKTFEVDKESVEQELDNAQHKLLLAPRSYRILQAYGFEVVDYAFVQSREEALKAAEELKYPLAASVMSPDITHKSGTGGVLLDVDGDEELQSAYDTIMQKVPEQEPDARIEGVLVQQMITEGAELIFGVQYDEQRGHLLMFGLGGKYVEVLEDVSFRLAPITELDAREMIKEVKAHKLIEGFRDIPPANQDALVEGLLRLSQLVTDFPNIKEIDLNPVFTHPDGLRVADARMIVAGER